MSEAGGGTGDLSVGEAVRLGLSMMPGGGVLGAGMAALWNNTNFIVDGRASAPGKGGGFELDVDTAEGLYREAKALAYELWEQVRDARDLSSINPPAEDPVSVGFNDVGSQAFEAGAQHVQAEADFYRGLARALGKALGVYQESDEQAGRDITIAG
ncbi:hypothetical protein, partial [Saccharomonospora viridis]|uniref:hypothetical protein n=1 Tax=Saccharomonospora viridis TaxID=1852 RepID=UPI0024A8A9BA